MTMSTRPPHCLSTVLKTKIVCTIGPASQDRLGELIEAGMNVARLNFAHCTHAFAAEVIANIRAYTAKERLGTHVAVWCDINGPKVRTGKISGGQASLVKGQEFMFVNEPVLENLNSKVSTTYPKHVVEPGDKIYVDDGILSFTVVERVPEGVRCVVENTGILLEDKGITFPSHIIEELPSISEKDREDIEFAMAQDVDYISFSCTRDIRDVEEVRMLLGNSRIKLLPKIENGRGLDNYDGILKMADGVVIDRGYLGSEIDVERVTTSQKEMIFKANVHGKAIMIANQMLESMKTYPRPTRSEAADVCNAVLDGADGLVLSAETAIGEYVTESVRVMRKIAAQAEAMWDYLEFQGKMMRSVPKPVAVSESIASSAVSAARQVDAKAIIVITELGGTARLIAKYRPHIPVLAATMFQRTARQLNLCYGVVAVYHPDSATIIREAMRTLRDLTAGSTVDLGFCSPGDVVVITSGQSIGFIEGTTTKMQILTVCV